MKDRLTDERIDEIISRARRLQPAAVPLWGSFSVNGMLYHCALINNAILTQKNTRPATPRERLFKAAFYCLPRLPQGVQTGKRFLAAQPDALQFENERTVFIESVNRFRQPGLALTGLHPYFGPLDTAEWRRFVWMHNDHHLRQFGV